MNLDRPKLREEIHALYRAEHEALGERDAQRQQIDRLTCLPGDVRGRSSRSPRPRRLPLSQGFFTFANRVKHWPEKLASPSLC